METCKSLAEQLGSPYTAMRVGKIRKNVCTDEDMNGKEILPQGVLKIMAAIRKEMDIKEIGEPEEIFVRVSHHKTGNPRRLYAVDPDTQRKVSVIVPLNRKRLLDIKGKKIKVQRGIQDGKHFYRYGIN
jgi:hypothetical protein